MNLAYSTTVKRWRPWDPTDIQKATQALFRRAASHSEFFNAFNTVSFGNPLNLLESGTAGQIASTSTGPSVIQFALKFTF
jgi:hypothetical protein